MSNDLSPEKLREMFKQRAAADEDLRLAQGQSAQEDDPEHLEPPRPVIDPAMLSKIEARMKKIDARLDSELRLREAQLDQNRASRETAEEKMNEVFRLMDEREEAAQKETRRWRLILAVIGAANLIATILMGILKS